MVHENSDSGVMYRTPIGYREGRPLNGVMTLEHFVDGGYEVVDAKILVVVKSVGARKRGVWRSQGLFDTQTDFVSSEAQG